MDHGAELMGRPKRSAKRSPSSAAKRAVILHMQGTAEYAEWLDALHRETHIPKAVIVRLALAAWAAENGHPKPPEM